MLSASSSLDETATFAGNAANRLRAADLPGAHQAAELSRLTALGAKSSSAIELAARATLSDAMAYAYADDRPAARRGIATARTLSGQIFAPRDLQIELELTDLHIREMARDLDSARSGFWSIGHQLDDRADAPSAIRALSRFMACSIWGGDLEAAETAQRRAEGIAAMVDDPNDLGSFGIWVAQLAILNHDFDTADGLLEESLELREQTNRRAITDLYAGALLELERGNTADGEELTDEFLRQTEEAGLLQYWRVGVETLLPRIA